MAWTPEEAIKYCNSMVKDGYGGPRYIVELIESLVSERDSLQSALQSTENEYQQLVLVYEQQRKRAEQAESEVAAMRKERLQFKKFIGNVGHRRNCNYVLSDSEAKCDCGFREVQRLLAKEPTSSALLGELEELRREKSSNAWANTEALKCAQILIDHADEKIKRQVEALRKIKQQCEDDIDQADNNSESLLGEQCRKLASEALIEG